MMPAVTVFEMTLDYDLVLPLLLASVLSSLIARRVAGDSVYSEALRRKTTSGDAGVLSTRRDVSREIDKADRKTWAENLLLPPATLTFLEPFLNG